MKHQKHKSLAVALGIGLLLAAGTAGDATAQTAIIKLGSFAPATSPSTVKAVKP